MHDSWNLLFTQGVRAFIDANWDTFTTKALEKVDKLRDRCLDALNSILQLLDGEAAALALPTQKFAGSLAAHAEGLLQAFDESKEEFVRDLRYVLAPFHQFQYANVTKDGPDGGDG